MNDTLIQFLHKKLDFSYYVGFTDEELVFFGIHFKTPGIFREILNLNNLLVAANLNR